MRDLQNVLAQFYYDIKNVLDPIGDFIENQLWVNS